MTAAYPSGLRSVLRASKARSQASTFTASDPQRGYAHIQATGRDVPVVWDIALAFTQSEAQVFRDWFRDDIAQGTAEFTLPIRTEFGLVEHVVRFMPDGLLDLQQNGAVWSYTAQIAARSAIVPVIAPVEAASVDIVAPTNCGTLVSVGVTISGLDPTFVYDVTLPAGRTYTAWSAFSTGDLWQNTLYVGAAGSFLVAFGDGLQYGTQELARSQFVGGSITGHSSYTFWMNDNNPFDNRGGLSIVLFKAREYPLGLRTVVSATKSRRQPAAFAMNNPRRGLGYARSIGTDTPLMWDVTFRFTQTEAADFVLWFTYILDRGLQSFTLPLMTEYGLISYAVRFMPGTLLDLREEGEVFTYSATLLARSEVTA